MKISYNWLKQYINTDLKPENIAEVLTDCGLEVEGIEKFQSIRGGLEGLVIGQVKSKIKHPDADKLSVTTVDAGTGNLLQIVCGAPNVAIDQKVIVALPGTLLFPLEGEPFEIKKSKIRGQASEGMICAEDEIGLGKAHDGIIVLKPDAVIGSLVKDYFNLQDDYIFEIGLTPNRADAASHMGVARDLAAALNYKAGNEKYLLQVPPVNNFKIENESTIINVSIEDIKACQRYSGITISGVQVKESPEWLVARLKSIGLKSINNIVDVTNFVLHETGQPLHAFDADRITGKKVIVKKAIKGSKFKTLDGVERELSGEELMICNSEKPMCIAGVFGGFESGITTDTKNIFLESAYFDPSTIRKASKHHDLKTDAAFRYERGTDPEITIQALKRAILLFKEVAGGTISSQIIDVYPEKIEPYKISLRIENCHQLIGKAIPKEEIKQILKFQQYQILSEDGNSLTLSVPTYKVDVKREQAVIEDILRIYGFNNIDFPLHVKSSIAYSEKPDKEKIFNTIAELLSGSGFTEILTNSLTKNHEEIFNTGNAKQNVEILNALSSELNVMRQNMLFSMLEVLVYNQNRKVNDLKLYEFGKTYHKKDQKGSNDLGYEEINRLSILLSGAKNAENWNMKQEKITFFGLKSTVLKVLRKLGISNFNTEESTGNLFEYGLTYRIKNSELVSFGEVKKPVLRHFDIAQPVFYADFNWEHVLKFLSSDVRYVEVSKFPEVRRDLALLINKEIKYSDIEKIAFQTEKNLLKEVNLFDVYEGDKLEKGKKSYAVSFTLQDHKGTLTDKQIDKVMEKLVEAFEKNTGARLR